MIRAFEGNTLGVALGSVCGALLLACLALVIVWAMPPTVDSGAGEGGDAELPGEVVSLQSAKALEEYSIVSERPVFNEDRRPALVLADGEGLEEIPLEDEFVGRPDVELAGIIITPSLRMATLRSSEHEFSLVAFEGKPLEGDFGTWQVSRIEERMVTLADAEGDEMQLELQVHDAMIKEPPKPEPAVDPAQQEGEETQVAEAGEADPSAPMTRAEEIRQRIEERREELRRAAEEREETQGQSYRDAIQSMIQNSRDRSEDGQAKEDG